MAEQIDQPEIDGRGYIRTKSNLLVPPGYGQEGWQGRQDRDRPGPILSSLLGGDGWWGQVDDQIFQPGHVVKRNYDYGFLELPAKGSGQDDLLSAAIVDGRIGNIGIAPVVSAQLSAILNRQISQARTAEITLNGRASPVRRARDSIAWYDDSPLGFSAAIGKVIYQMRVFNRGAPHATIPITLATDQWGGYGLDLVPLNDRKRLYYLTVDWDLMGAPVPFLPNPFDLQPTGDREWPYWYKKELRQGDGNPVWILLHQTQIFSLIPGVSWQSGVGTCAVYMFWEWVADLALEKIRRAEKQIHQPAHGLLTIDGVTATATQIKNEIMKDRIERDAQGRKLDKGITVITGRDAIHAAFMSFRESYADYSEFKQALEDALAQVFNEPLSSVVTREGVGYSAQTNANVQGSADAGVDAILIDVSSVLGAMHKRVKIFVQRPNTATKVRTMENFQTFAQAVGGLPDGTLTQAEIRALIHSLIVEIPQTGDSATASANPNEDQSDNNDPNGGDGGGNAEEVENQALLYTVKRLAPIKPTGTAKGRAPQADKRSQQDSLYERWDREFPDYDHLLTAQENRADDDPVIWLWNSDLIRYRRADQIVDRDLALVLRDELRQIRQVDADDLAADLATGRITLQQWLDGIQDAVEEGYVTQGALARGGVDQLSDEDLEWLDDALAGPFDEVASLAERIGEGLYSEAQIANFTRNTIYGSVHAYEGMNASAHGVRSAYDLPAYPGDGSSECQKRCHCYWVFKRGSAGELLATWTHPPLHRRIPGIEPCRTCERRIREWRDIAVERTTRQSAQPTGQRIKEMSAAGRSVRQMAAALAMTEQAVRNAQTKMRKRGDLGYTRAPARQAAAK